MKNIPTRYGWSLVFMLAAVALACNSGDQTWLAAPEDELAAHTSSASPQPEADEVGTAQQAVISGTHKVCTVYVPGNWRDTILVPDAWAASTCIAWKNAVSASQARMGCMVGNNISVATCEICFPPDNTCGWF